MKLDPKKGFKGTPEELKYVCENHNFEPTVFFKNPNNLKLKTWMFIGLIILFIVVSLLIWGVELHELLRMLLILIDFILVFVITSFVHLKYDNSLITLFAFIGAVVILSISLGILTPEEAIDDIKKNIPIKVDS